MGIKQYGPDRGNSESEPMFVGSGLTKLILFGLPRSEVNAKYYLSSFILLFKFLLFFSCLIGKQFCSIFYSQFPFTSFVNVYMSPKPLFF